MNNGNLEEPLGALSKLCRLWGSRRGGEHRACTSDNLPPTWISGSFLNALSLSHLTGDHDSDPCRTLTTIRAMTSHRTWHTGVVPFSFFSFPVGPALSDHSHGAMADTGKTRQSPPGVPGLLFFSPFLAWPVD